ncbi:ECF transporter S component, partial [Streptomyces spiralis]
MTMSDKKIRKLVVSALMAALTYVATMVIQIPSPMNGYVNLGDCFVLLSGWLLGPWWGGAAAGIGSMLTDLFAGYTSYAPGTF